MKGHYELALWLSARPLSELRARKISACRAITAVQNVVAFVKCMREWYGHLPAIDPMFSLDTAPRARLALPTQLEAPEQLSLKLQNLFRRKCFKDNATNH